MVWWILLLLLILVLLTLAYGGYSAAIWVPTFQKDVTRAITLADIRPGDVVYDLGSGDGRLNREAARLGAISIGYEIAIPPLAYAWLRSVVSPYRKKLKFRFADFWKQDISDADVVFVYLLSKSYDRLKQKIETECASGTKIIVFAWPIEEWRADAVIEEDGRLNIYKYIVP